MTNQIDERALRLRLAVEGRFDEWRESPGDFAVLYPEIRMEFEIGKIRHSMR
jgi:hypothetical protein